MMSRFEGTVLRFFGVVIVTIMIFMFGLTNVQNAQGLQSKEQLEDSIRKAAVLCYASEGIYPPNLAYICEHYGLRYDENRFLVVYEPIASNLMPEITILEYQP